MSAFLCSDLHVITLAAALCKADLADDPVSAAQQLRDANNKALKARYGDEPVPLGSVKGALVDATHLDGAAANTLARCFRYQCAEGDVLETHPVIPKVNRLIELTGGSDGRTVQGLWGI